VVVNEQLGHSAHNRPFVPLRKPWFYEERDEWSIESTGLGWSHRDLRADTILVAAETAPYKIELSALQFGGPQVTAAPAVRLPVEMSIAYEADFARQSAGGLIETIVRQLLAKEHVLTARKLINALPPERISAEPLRQLRSLLAEPVVRRRLPARASRSADFDWLRHNANAYRGKWVAVANGGLLDSDESLDALLRRLRQTVPDTAPFLHRL